MKLIFCAALALANGVAGAAVNKCVDQKGHVLFTDAECPVATEPVKEEEQPVAAPVLAPVASPAPRSRWADLPRPLTRKTVSVDTSTLAAARQNLLLEDELHKSRRLISSR